MSEVGIRALKQNASAVVSEAAPGQIVTLTDRGRPVAQMPAIHKSRLQPLIDADRVRTPRRGLADLAPAAGGRSLHGSCGATLPGRGRAGGAWLDRGTGVKKAW